MNTNIFDEMLNATKEVKEVQPKQQPKKQVTTATQRTHKEETKKTKANDKGGRPKVYTEEELKRGEKNKVTIKPYKEYLADYLENIYFFKDAEGNRIKEKSLYITNLIKTDLTKRLGLKSNVSEEELLKAWKQYKKENNI